MFDAEGRIVHLEGPALPNHGLRHVDWTGRRLSEVLPADAVAAMKPHWEAALLGEPQTLEYRSQDGTRLYCVQAAPLKDPEGVVRTVVAVVQDITETQRTLAELEGSQARLRLAERLVQVGTWELVPETGELTLSEGAVERLGLATGERVDLDTYLQLVVPEDREALLAALAAALETGWGEAEYRLTHRDGSTRILTVQGETARDERGAVYLRGAVHEVTAQRDQERRRLAAESVFREGFEASPIGMGLTDPASWRFLRVNDALCQMLGRSRDEIIGHTPAEFTDPQDRAVIDLPRARALAGESCGPVEKRYRRPDGTIVWASVHLTPVRSADGTVEAVHSQILDITAHKEHEATLARDVGDALWLARIRDALDDERLLLYTQPIIDLRTGETVQQEVLLRMRSEDGTVIGPGEFLPVAERYGLISEIDRWVLGQAVKLAAAGQPTEFNLSARSIGDPSILRELATALQESGADPSLLVIEVTETAIVEQLEIGRAFAEGVHGLGCQLALDDFGTGFGSFYYLKHLPVGYLKLDGEFIQNLPRSPVDEHVVRAIVGVAQALGIKTVAESVSDGETIRLLEQHGIDYAQGFHIGMPQPIE